MTGSSSEARRRPRRFRKFALLLGPLALAAAPRQQAPVDGEYGLYVQLLPDSLVVQWLTQGEGPGVLEVLADGQASPRLTTAAARAHRAALPRPRGDAVTLRYGTEAGPLFATQVLLSPPRREPVERRAVDSLYVVGDTHGEFDALIGTLRAAGLIGDSLEWTGGRKHLVFDGDLTDRGRDVTRLLWFVYRLEREAAAAGGRVHVLLGNHELMAMAGDLRYVHSRESALAEAHGVSYDRLLHVSESVLGRWLASKPGSIRIGGTLIVHGGVASEFTAVSLRQLDALLAGYLAPAMFYRAADSGTSAADSARLQGREDFFWHPRSLFWFRDYVQTDTAGAQLDSVLHRFAADVMVVGHTAVPQIQARYGGRLIAAHTSRYGADLLLLVRDRGQYRRYRIGPEGVPEAF